MASKTESAKRPGARLDARTKGVGAEGTAAWKATLQGADWSRLIIGALNTRYWRTCISIAAFQMGGKQKHKAEAQGRSTGQGARLESEAIHGSARQSRKSWRTPYFRQSRAQRAPREGALAECVAGKRSRPRGYPGRGSDWGFAFVHFYVAHPKDSRRQKKKSPSFARIGRLKPAPLRGPPRRMQYPLCYNPA